MRVNIRCEHHWVSMVSHVFTFCVLCPLENCSMQKKGNINNDDRTAKACETQQFNKIDYGSRSSACYFQFWELDWPMEEPTVCNIFIYSVQSESARLYRWFVHWHLHRAGFGRHQRRWVLTTLFHLRNEHAFIFSKSFVFENFVHFALNILGAWKRSFSQVALGQCFVALIFASWITVVS